MKFWIKVLFIGIIVMAILFSAAYTFVTLKGKAMVAKTLNELTHKKISVGYVSLRPLFNLEIRNIDVEGLGKIDFVSVSPGIIGFLTGNIAFNDIKIIRPEFTFERTLPLASPGNATASADLSAPSLPQIEKAPAKPLTKKKLRLVLKNFNIRQGTVNFIDRNAGKDGIKITVKDIYVSLSNLYLYPHSAISNFDLSGKIPWSQGQEEGKIRVNGWVNLYKKDMQAEIKISDIDGVYLYPYYSAWVDLDKARIDKARLNFTSNIKGLNNNITADCHLELTDIVRKVRPPDEKHEKAEIIADAIIGMFKGLDQGRILLDFTLKTKMDRPEFKFTDIRMAFEDKLSQARKASGIKPKDVAAFPVRLLKGTVKGATDISKAMIDGILAIGKEIQRSAEDPLRREK